jgi:hypothetical protein
MSVEIKSGASTDLQTIDPVSKASRVTIYNSAGEEAVPSLPIDIPVASVTAINNDLIASTDVSLYKFISLQILGTWNGTVDFQGSNDGGSFVPLTVQDMGTILSPYVLSISANGIYTVAVSMKYLRVRVTSYATGTVYGVAAGYKEMNTNGQISATSSTPTTPVLTYLNMSSVVGTNETLVQTGQTTVHSLSIMVHGAASILRFIKFYNAATVPVPGVGTPLLTIGQYGTLSSPFTVPPGGVDFPLGLGFVIGTVHDPASVAAPAAVNEVSMTIGYT